MGPKVGLPDNCLMGPQLCSSSLPFLFLLEREKEREGKNQVGPTWALSDTSLTCGNSMWLKMKIFNPTCEVSQGRGVSYLSLMSDLAHGRSFLSLWIARASGQTWREQDRKESTRPGPITFSSITTVISKRKRVVLERLLKPGLTVDSSLSLPLRPSRAKKKRKREDNGRDYRRMDSWAQVKSLINSLLGPGYPIRRLFH